MDQLKDPLPGKKSTFNKRKSAGTRLPTHDSAKNLQQSALSVNTSGSNLQNSILESGSRVKNFEKKAPKKDLSAPPKGA